MPERDGKARTKERIAQSKRPRAGSLVIKAMLMIVIIIIIIMIIMWRAPRTTMVDPKVSPKDWHSTNQFLDMPRACPP